MFDKLSFKVTDYIIQVILPCDEETPSMLGNYSRCAFNNHADAVDEIRSIEGVLHVHPLIKDRQRMFFITCDSVNEPYHYMRQFQEIGRKYGYFREGQKEKNDERHSQRQSESKPTGRKPQRRATGTL